MREEQLMKSAREAGLPRKATQDRGCSARCVFAPRDRKTARIWWPQSFPASIGSDISLLLPIFFFPCCLYRQKQVMEGNQELWFPASTVAQAEKPWGGVWTPRETMGIRLYKH